MFPVTSYSYSCSYCYVMLKVYIVENIKCYHVPKRFYEKDNVVKLPTVSQGEEVTCEQTFSIFNVQIRRAFRVIGYVICYLTLPYVGQSSASLLSLVLVFQSNVLFSKLSICITRFYQSHSFILNNKWKTHNCNILISNHYMGAYRIWVPGKNSLCISYPSIMVSICFLYIVNAYHFYNNTN